MTARHLAVHGDDAGRIVLHCDGPQCDARFTIRVFRTGQTRVSAQVRFRWAGVGVRDYCPQHADEVTMANPAPVA